MAVFFLADGFGLALGLSVGLRVAMGVFFLGLAIPIWIDTMRTLVTIDDQSVTVRRAFKTRAMLLADIAGYRVGAKNIFSIEDKMEGKPLQLPQNVVRRKELVEYFTQRYIDLDTKEREAETAVLLEDERYGLTREEREARLAMAKRFDGVALFIGIALFFWALVYPSPFEFVMITCFVMPLAGVAITWYFKGLLRLDKRKKSPYPSVVQMIVFPTLGALFGVLRSYDLYEFGKQGWSLTLIGTAIAAVIFIAGCWQAIYLTAKKVVPSICIIIMSGLYSFSLVVYYNCYYDESTATVYNVKITDKRISRGKTTTYYVSLSPWGRFTEGKETSVSRDFYESIGVDDSINVFLNKGKLGVPWYRLMK